jgi:hypothetical protein
MTAGFEKLHYNLKESDIDMIDAITNIVSNQTSDLQQSQIDIQSGQQDLNQSLTRMAGNITACMSENETSLATSMEKLLKDHFHATEVLMATANKSNKEAMALQVRRLVSNINRHQISL